MAGPVFVQDMNGTFYSRIVQIDPVRIRVSGCIPGGLVCKLQVWSRV